MPCLDDGAVTSGRPDFSLSRFLRAETVGGMILLSYAYLQRRRITSPFRYVPIAGHLGCRARRGRARCLRAVRGRVPLTGASPTALVRDRIAIAIIVGLVVGKLVGILGGAALAIVSGIAVRPAGLPWRRSVVSVSR